MTFGDCSLELLSLHRLQPPGGSLPHLVARKPGLSFPTLLHTSHNVNSIQGQSMGGPRERKSSGTLFHALDTYQSFLIREVSTPLQLQAPSQQPRPTSLLWMAWGWGEREQQNEQVFSSLSDPYELPCLLLRPDREGFSWILSFLFLILLWALFVYTHCALPGFGVPLSPGWAIMKEK